MLLLKGLGASLGLEFKDANEFLGVLTLLHLG